MEMSFRNHQQESPVRTSVSCPLSLNTFLDLKCFMGEIDLDFSCNRGEITVGWGEIGMMLQASGIAYVSD